MRSIQTAFIDWIGFFISLFRLFLFCLFCFILFCSVLFYFVLFCSVLFCSVLGFMYIAFLRIASSIKNLWSLRRHVQNSVPNASANVNGMNQ